MEVLVKDISLEVLVTLLLAICGGFLLWLFFSKKNFIKYFKEDWDPNNAFIVMILILLVLFFAIQLIHWNFHQ